MDATDVSSDNVPLSDTSENNKNHHNQHQFQVVALLHQRNAFDRLRTNEVKMAEKGSEKYSELSWTSTESPCL